MARPLACALALACAPMQTEAHPHIFVDAGLVLHLDEQARLTSVDVIWAYDPFYSLLVFEDLGLDGNFDGMLTEQELRRLEGFDLAWIDGYEGDTYVASGETHVTLGAPQHVSTEVEQGQIFTRHRRNLSEPVAADGLVLRAYDPTYYTAYTMSQGVRLEGSSAVQDAAKDSCEALITPPNLDQAYTLVEELLYAMPTSQAEEAYPEVGAAFADTIQISCVGS